MGKKSAQKIAKRTSAKKSAEPIMTADGFRVVEIQGQKVQTFQNLNQTSQAATRLCQFIQQFAKIVPLGDAAQLFVDIQQGATLINNTLVIEAEAEVKRLKAAADNSTPAGNDLLKD